MRTVLAAAALFALTASAPADEWGRFEQGPKPLPADGVIRDPGNYYLTGHRSAPTHVIQIKASFVSLDLRGYQVKCTPANPATTTSIGITAGGLNYVTIRNGIITGCWTGSYAQGTHNLLIENIDYSRNTYIGHNGGGSYAVFRFNIFAAIKGYSLEPYAIGINDPGNACTIERNVFRNLYRQPGYPGGAGGEGVGVLTSHDTAGCVVRYNTFENMATGDPAHLDIGVWAGSNTSISVQKNTFSGLPRAVFSYQWTGATINAFDNRLWLQSPQVGSLGIAAPAGVLMNNLIVGYETPTLGVTDAGGNLIVP